MSSYAMQGAPDNGFSLMTDCPAVTQFMLNSFSAVQFHKCNFVGLCRIVLDWGGGGGGGASRRCALSELTVPTSCNDSPALFYCIVFCIIVLLVKGLGDTAICQVHLLGEMQRNNGRSYGSLSVIK